MPDDIELDPGSGGAKIKTDDDGTAHWQYVKVAFGADNTQTIVGSISSNPFPVALSAIDNAVLDTIAASLALLDNAISAGNELQVDVVAALPTGANTIGDVTVSGDALTALQLLDNIVVVEDAVHGSGDPGIMALAVRNDVLATLAGADGDYAPLQVNASGALFIQEGAAMDVSAATVTVDLAGNNDVTIDGSSIVLAEDAVHSSGAAGVMALVVRNDVLAALAGTDGDYAPLQVNSSGALFVEVSSSVALVVDLGANNDVTITGDALAALELIDNPVAVLGTATYLEATTSAMIIGAVRNDTLATLASLDNEIAPLQVNASGALYIQEGSALDVSAATLTVNAHAVTNAGTFPVQVDGDALTALQLIDDVVVVEDAAAAANPTGNMIMTVRDDEVGSTAIATADNDVQALRSNQFGELKVTQIPDSTSEFKYAIIDAASSGNNTIQASAGAGKKIRVLAAFLVAAGTVNARFESAADGTALTGQMNLVVNTGFVLPFNPAGWFETADDALLNLELSAGVSVDGSVTYVEI